MFSLIIRYHLGRHFGFIEMLNDARVASLKFFEDNVCITRINKEKKFKIKFQVLPEFAQILPDYTKVISNRIFKSMFFNYSQYRLGPTSTPVQ